jgi:hypothetical protein
MIGAKGNQDGQNNQVGCLRPCWYDIAGYRPGARRFARLAAGHLDGEVT